MWVFHSFFFITNSHSHRLTQTGAVGWESESSRGCDTMLIAIATCEEAAYFPSGSVNRTLYSLEGYYSYTVTLRAAHFFETFSAIAIACITTRFWIARRPKFAVQQQSLSTTWKMRKYAARGCSERFSVVVHACSYANKALKGSRVWFEGDWMAIFSEKNDIRRACVWLVFLYHFTVSIINH